MTQKKTSYDIVRMIRELSDEWETALIDSEGEITSKIEEIEARLNEATDDAVSKIENIKRFIGHIEEQKSAMSGIVEYHKTKLDEFKRSEKSLDNTVDWMRKKVLSLMDAAGMSDLKIDGRKVWIQTTEVINEDENSGETLRELSRDDADLSRFFKEKISVDKKEIKTALKNGEDLAGMLDAAKIEIVENRSVRGL